MVYGDAKVFGYAKVYDKALVYGDANVSGNAEVSDKAMIYGNANVFDNAEILDKAQVYDHACVFGDARISDKAQVYDHAYVSGDAKVYGDARISGNACIENIRQYYDFDCFILGDNHVHVYMTKDKKIEITCGGFCGDIEAFEKIVKETVYKNHLQEMLAIIKKRFGLDG